MAVISAACSRMPARKHSEQSPICMRGVSVMWKPLPSLPGMGFGANDAVRPFLDAMVFTTDLYVMTSSADRMAELC